MLWRSFSLPHRFRYVILQLWSRYRVNVQQYNLLDTVSCLFIVCNTAEMPTPKFSLVERILLIKLWYRNEGSFKDVIEEFAFESPSSAAPNLTTIWRLVKCFDEFGMVADKPHSSRPKTSMTEENLQLVSQMLVEKSNQSTKCVSLHLEIPCTSLRRI